jgi:hypothetical protein
MCRHCHLHRGEDPHILGRFYSNVHVPQSYPGMLNGYILDKADVQGWMDRVPKIDSLIDEKGAEVATLEKESDGITL